jgi:lipoprotein NlpI
LNATHAPSFHNRGCIRYARRENDLAIADFTRALEINANYALAYRNRALAYDQVGRADLAQQDRQRAGALGLTK